MCACVFFVVVELWKDYPAKIERFRIPCSVSPGKCRSFLCTFIDSINKSPRVAPFPSSINPSQFSTLWWTLWILEIASPYAEGKYNPLMALSQTHKLALNGYSEANRKKKAYEPNGNEYKFPNPSIVIISDSWLFYPCAIPSSPYLIPPISKGRFDKISKRSQLLC